MKPWKIVALAILAIPIVSLATCFIPYDWREALVIEVETPDGVKTGRSVVLVSHTIEAIVPGSPGGAAKLGLINKDHPLIAALPPQEHDE